MSSYADDVARKIICGFFVRIAALLLMVLTTCLTLPHPRSVKTRTNWNANFIAHGRHSHKQMYKAYKRGTSWTHCPRCPISSGPCQLRWRP
eukprot:1328505-Pyramimonas_sp.AAC.1